MKKIVWNVLLCGTALVAPTAALAQTAPVDADPAAASAAGAGSSVGADAATALGSAADTKGESAATPDDAGGLQDIVVTARRRAESLLSVPVAVTVISQSAIENNLVTSLPLLGELAPQVLIGSNTSGTGALLGIRGISSSPQDAGIDQSVSIDFDGVQLSRGRIITTSLFDIAQVQVLQGPQALFFGKNSPAGVISIKSADPTKTLEGYLQGAYEFAARERSLEGAVSGPITSNLQGRFAFRASKMDGWVKVYGEPFSNPVYGGATTYPHSGREPGDRTLAGRVSLAWQPADDFDAKLKLTYNDQRLNDGAGNSEAFCTGDKTQLHEVIGIDNPYGDCKKDRRKSIGELPPEIAAGLPYGNGGKPYQRAKIFLSVLELNKKFENVTVTSTTGYYHQTVADANNGDHAILTTIYFAEREKYDLFSQELRATTDFPGSVNFTVGAYFSHFKRPFFNAPIVLDTGVNPETGNYAASEEHISNSGSTYSLFGQVRWKILPNLELAGGARWTRETKKVDSVYTAVNPTEILGPLRPVGDHLPGSYSDNDVSPEVTLTWRITPNQSLYGAYKQGYKSGGFSNVAVLPATYTADDLEFGAEKSNGFEIGYKAEFPDARLRFDLTVYRYNYRDLQVSAFDAATISYNIQNAASARTEGVQGSLLWLATNRLTINGNFGYNRGRLRKFPNAQCYGSQSEDEGCVDGTQDLSNRQLPRAPSLTFDIGGQYTAALSDGWNADFSMDTSYSSSYYSEETHDPALKQKSFVRLNAAVHLHPKDERFDIALIGRNLTDTYYLAYGIVRPFGPPDEFVGFFNRPREVVVQAKYKF